MVWTYYTPGPRPLPKIIKDKAKTTTPASSRAPDKRVILSGVNYRWSPRFSDDALPRTRCPSRTRRTKEKERWKRALPAKSHWASFLRSHIYNDVLRWIYTVNVISCTWSIVSPKKIISFRVSSTIRSWIMNHFSLSPPPPPARRWAFQTVFSLSRVVPATDSWVTLAIRSYRVDLLSGGASTSAWSEKISPNQAR